MTSTTNLIERPDNPPAFPREGYNQLGMTLRDWFAGQALAGLCVTFCDGETYKHVSQTAYRHADAMLAARGVS
jgi:hypothetical protein